MKKLEISETLSLPSDYVTQRGALLAVSGAGKSNGARAIAEEFFKAELPFVAVDPKGDWWGLRAGKDGKPKGGLGVVIFGGKHGDLPLEREGGKVVADAVVDQRLSCILDLSRFESEAAKRHFLLDFTSRLYFRNEDPLHLFLDEADVYIPQKVRGGGDAVKLLGMMDNIVRRGRTKGIGVTLISQRSAVLNKDALYMAETLFALRTVGPGDIGTVESWMKYHGADRALLASLAGLKDGEAWVWSPHYLQKTEKFRFRLSHTFDSGATPKNHTAKARKAAATLADVDLKELGAAMAAAVERAKDDDPKALRARIGELERQLRLKTTAPAEAKVERVEVPVLGAVEVGLLDELAGKTTGLAGQVADLVRVVKERAYDGQSRGARPWKDVRRSPADPERSARVDARVRAEQSMTTDELVAGQRKKIPPDILRQKLLGSADNGKETTYSVGDLPKLPRTYETKGSADNGKESPTAPGKLGKCARSLLAVLARHGDMSLQQAAMIAGYPGSAPIVVKSAGELRSGGLVVGSNGMLVVTRAGHGRPEIESEPFLPVGRELAEYWMARVSKCERVILASVRDAHPKALSLADAVKGHYEGTEPIVVKSAGRLRSLELVQGSNAALTLNERLV